MDYANGKIYKIISNMTDDIYVGSTCQLLCRRMASHRSYYNRFINGSIKCSKSSFEILKHGDATIVLIEKYPSNNKEELHRRERHYIETLKCVNKVIPTRTRKEYTEQHKDESITRAKEYYNNNKETVLKYQKTYAEVHINELKAYRTDFRKDNIEKIRNREKAYYNDNKELVAQRRKQPFTCECGTIITSGIKSQHRKTQKHKNLLLPKE